MDQSGSTKGPDSAISKKVKTPRGGDNLSASSSTKGARSPRGDKKVQMKQADGSGDEESMSSSFSKSRSDKLSVSSSSSKSKSASKSSNKPSETNNAAGAGAGASPRSMSKVQIFAYLFGVVLLVRPWSLV